MLDLFCCVCNNCFRGAPCSHTYVHMADFACLCFVAANSLAPIPEEGSRELADSIPAKHKVAADYPGLEPDLLPDAVPLFKFKAQAYPEDNNRADRIAAGAAQEMAMYNVVTDASPTFREMPLDPAISISPRQTLRNSLLGRTSSSIGPQSSNRDLMRSQSSLMQRSGSTISQYVGAEVMLDTVTCLSCMGTNSVQRDHFDVIYLISYTNLHLQSINVTD